MVAYCVEKREERDFAISGLHEWTRALSAVGAP